MVSRFRALTTRGSKSRALVSEFSITRWFVGFRQTEVYDDVPAVHHFGDCGSKVRGYDTGLLRVRMSRIDLNPKASLSHNYQYVLREAFERKFFTKV